jgi:N-acetylneuraminic acid mutarotase
LLIVFPGLTFSYEGEIAQWKEIGNLPSPINIHQCLSEKNVIYCIGGHEISNKTNNVWYATMNTDNSLSEWKSGASLPDNVEDLQCVTENGFIYCAGGENDDSYSYSYIDKVWYVKINEDGSLLNWQATTSLPIKIRNHQCFTANGYLYCAGGSDKNLLINNVWYTRMNTDGTIGEWKSTTNLPEPIAEHQCLAYNDFIYCLGGVTNEQANIAWYTKINYDGTLDSWKTTTLLPNVIDDHRCFTANGYIYCSGGGKGDSSSCFKDVWLNKNNSDGTLGEWRSTSNLPIAIRNHEIVTINSFIYSLGGYPYTNNIYFTMVLPYLSTHPNQDYWYITDNLTFLISIDIPNGYYYVIDNNPETTVTPSNSQYETQKTLVFSSGLAVEYGTHYLHFALADSNALPMLTCHYCFHNYSDPLQIIGSTHSNQEEWYQSSNLGVQLNGQPGINFRYVIDTELGTIPDSTSTVSLTDNFVLPNQPAGTHYLHIRAEDTSGNLAPENFTKHFRFNIYDQNQTKPPSLPVVKELNVTPINVSKDGKLSIQATISVE